ncbi:hypothetical protein PIB30_080249 [Stylosanthes scabra]|uniref:Uncharacterized protein n=1 Tax=Stylosanthes scabra TaxID=79078 RepID=A0ABU6QR14_9FABA|nr:hypothetical protein [Stylosanthes scabra]
MKDATHQYLMTPEAEEVLEGIEAVDSTIRIQRMLLRAAVHYWDVQREVAGISKLQNMLSKKENRIKTLGSQVTELEAKEKSRGAEVLRLEGVEKRLNEKVKAAENKDIELQACLKKAHEDLASMEKAKVGAAMSALTAVADIEKTMLEQVSLLAPGTDFSKVSSYNKVVDGQIVEAPSNELPELWSIRSNRDLRSQGTTLPNTFESLTILETARWPSNSGSLVPCSLGAMALDFVGSPVTLK